MSIFSNWMRGLASAFRVAPDGFAGDTANAGTRRWWAGGIALALLLPAGLAFSVSSMERGATATMQAMRDPLAVLMQRSPGVRQEGLLHQTKRRRYDDNKPRERVLTTIRERTPFSGEMTPVSFDGDLPFIGGGVPEPQIWPMRSNGPGEGIYLTSFSGGCGDGVGPTFPACGYIPGSGVSAVPEPTTWLTMILGFFAAGSAIRWGKTRAMRRREQLGAR